MMKHHSDRKVVRQAAPLSGNADALEPRALPPLNAGRPLRVGAALIPIARDAHVLPTPLPASAKK